MVRGSCLCGDVVWEASAPLELMSHCHCSICRKSHGSPFATYVAAPAESFRLVQGREGITSYRSSESFRRPFCGRCGTPVPMEAFEGRVFMAAGPLDTDPEVRPLAHIFVGSKAPWYEITDTLPRFEGYPPGYEAPPVKGEERRLSEAGVVRGSCLCDRVAWELAGELDSVTYCHCTRCRKARGAAHASNLFGKPGEFRWLRGEELLSRFKVPEAERFAQAFCQHCGSSMPRVSERAAVIPGGCIDGDPGARGRRHIFVGSKAPWYEISDELPQFDGYPPPE